MLKDVPSMDRYVSLGFAKTTSRTDESRKDDGMILSLAQCVLAQIWHC